MPALAADAVAPADAVAADAVAPADGATATPYAGTGDPGYAGDDGPAVAAVLNQPGGVAVAPDGVVYVADTGNGVVRAISADGVIRTVPVGEDSLNHPSSLAVDAAGTIYIGDNGNARILSLPPDGDVTVVAGGNGAGFAGDGGPATEAQLRDVSGLTVDADDGLVFGDLRNYRVRRIDTSGLIDTLIGSGDVGLVAGGDAASFTFPYAPISTADDPDGGRWVASTLLYGLSDNRMRAVVRDGDSRWTYSESQSAEIPAGAWQGTLYLAATANARYLSTDDGLYRFHPDGRVETLLADPSIAGPLTMVDDQLGYLVDPRQHKVYRLELPAISSTGGDGDRDPDGAVRPWWVLAAGLRSRWHSWWRSSRYAAAGR
ncbi:hypothetical protein O7608_10000 [Solwaraspora sp. WMMA2056]|uniref:NHL domain-containing protein n=1 Tax=Solwaraspora sp. WMMA2056 TaxID=3015161 RepID=UPI00259AF5F9|nr:hypothetical protein [Solwaraspora sp. WMMA2056]WJK42673.1 hypothetical protein O7608_10000 [Solwaraspora sp. WMMA2056]